MIFSVGFVFSVSNTKYHILCSGHKPTNGFHQYGTFFFVVFSEQVGVTCLNFTCSLTKMSVKVPHTCGSRLLGWGKTTRTLVPRTQGFRHPTRNECVGWFVQIRLLAMPTGKCGHDIRLMGIGRNSNNGHWPLGWSKGVQNERRFAKFDPPPNPINSTKVIR